MKVTEEEFIFLKPSVRDFEKFIKELRPLLEAWATVANDTLMDESWKRRKREAAKLEKAVENLSPQTRHFFGTFTGFSDAELLRPQEACILAQDPPRKINGIPVSGRKPRQGTPQKIELDVLIDRLHILLCQHTKSLFPPEKNTALFNRFAKSAFACANLECGEDAIRKRIERANRTERDKNI